jgi:hypothetical protein
MSLNTFVKWNHSVELISVIEKDVSFEIFDYVIHALFSSFCHLFIAHGVLLSGKSENRF